MERLFGLVKNQGNGDSTYKNDNIYPILLRFLTLLIACYIGLVKFIKFVSHIAFLYRNKIIFHVSYNSRQITKYLSRINFTNLQYSLIQIDDRNRAESIYLQILFYPILQSIYHIIFVSTVNKTKVQYG